MKRLVLAVVAIVVGSIITATSSFAGQATDALVVCMTDHTTGKDRKDMARWIFVGMAGHPEIQHLSNVTEKDREELDMKLAAIVTRLLTENCKAQTKVALENEADGAPLKTTFGILGQLAMQELMNNSSVQAEFTRFAKYLDKEKFKSLGSD